MLEVIAKNIRDIEKINLSNADRIEFCDQVDLGGTTPRLKDIKKAIKISKKPVMIIIRNHTSNFQITQTQLVRDLKWIETLKTIGAHGIVWGAITKDGKIDKAALKKVMLMKGDLELTFHKAFDCVADKIKAAQELKKLGVTRILTSGGVGSPMENLETLKQLKNEGIEILVGGGVNKDNITSLREEGFNNIHIGRAARKKNSWKKRVDIKTINNFCKI